MLLTAILYFSFNSLSASTENFGELEIKSSGGPMKNGIPGKNKTYIYINGEKKAILGSKGITNISLAEGDYEIKIAKEDDDGMWIHSSRLENVFIGSGVLIKLELLLGFYKTPTETKSGLMEEDGFGISRYSDHEDGTVTDEKTNLMWKKCPEGKKQLKEKNYSTCVRSTVTRSYTWKEAVNRAKTMQFAGYSDWRLPSLNELSSLVYCSNKNKRKKITFDNSKSVYKNNGGCLGENFDGPTINQAIFRNTDLGKYWTSSYRKSKRVDDDVWVVQFRGYGGGEISTRPNGEFNKFYVRLVRDN